MAPLWTELSSLEVEPLEVVENAPVTEQDSSLYTITVIPGVVDVDALTGKAVALEDGQKCCCCSVPCCVCCLA